PSTYTYNLKSKYSKLNFVFTSFLPGNAGEYLTGSDGNLETATTLGNANTYGIPHIGVELNDHYGDPAFLAKIKDQGLGVILIEGEDVPETPFNVPITVEVKNNDTEENVMSFSLNISLSGVEDMFRHRNFTLSVSNRHVNDDRGDTYGWDKNVGPDNRTGQPDNYPDSETNGKNFVFVHGYNVNGQSARGWQAEMFKRMYWAGSKAKFWGVTWYGWHTQDVLWEGDITLPFTPNYHINVMHAFDTAGHLADYFNNSVAGEKTFAAHSLGNMVVSSALS
ncbi:MAG: hypothetical protein RQ824_12855, partial [bacterium]|nr:hypothetical protein [bacterium]